MGFLEILFGLMIAVFFGLMTLGFSMATVMFEGDEPTSYTNNPKPWWPWVVLCASALACLGGAGIFIKGIVDVL